MPRRKRSELTVNDTRKLHDAVREFLLIADGRRLSPRTMEWYEQKLQHFEDWMTEHGHTSLNDLSMHLLRAYFADVSSHGTGLVTPQWGVVDRLSSRTVKGYYQVMKSFLRYLYQDGLVKQPFHDFLKNPKLEKYVIKVFSAEQIRSMLTVAKRTDLPLRDVAILSLLVDTGIRAGELCSLTLDNTSLALHGSWVRVTGKGNNSREIPLGSESRLAVYRYVARERPDCARPEVFLSYGARPMSPGGLHSLVSRLGDEAHVTGIRCSPHTFRHTFATRYLESGGDIYKLSKLLGHGSVKVTEMYTRTFSLEHTASDTRSILGDVLGSDGQRGRRRFR